MSTEQANILSLIWSTKQVPIKIHIVIYYQLQINSNIKTLSHLHTTNNYYN